MTAARTHKTAGPPHYRLCLYIAGATPRSLRAIAALQTLNVQRLPGRCTLTVVDIRHHPQQALAGAVVAAPTLVREQPLPEQRVVGDCSNLQRVCADLDLR